MAEKHLLLYLDAPMQSWCSSSRFTRRITNSWPTKSGILGMLCAAMGIERDDEGGISRLAEFRMSVYVLKDTGQRLSDFHTVGVGYDKTGEKGFISRKIEKKNPNTVLTRREYLIDCKFSVLLSGNQELVEQCASALVNPRWGVWLGRKSCIPAARICEGTFDTVDLAKKRLEEITATPNRQRIKRCCSVR